MNEITGRIREVFEHSGINQSELARCLKVTPSYIWKLLNKDDVTPSERFIDDICEKFQIRKEWLEHGDGNPERPLDRQDEIPSLQQICSKVKRIPSRNVLSSLWLTWTNLNGSCWRKLRKKLQKKRTKDFLSPLTF